LRDPKFSRFDTIGRPECDRHTNTETDGHATTAYMYRPIVLSIASRGKKEKGKGQRTGPLKCFGQIDADPMSVISMCLTQQWIG